jgi:hypothetical protein
MNHDGCGQFTVHAQYPRLDAAPYRIIKMYDLCGGVNTRISTARTSRFNGRICNATERQLQCLLDGGNVTAFLGLPTVKRTAIVFNPQG